MVTLWQKRALKPWRSFLAGLTLIAFIGGQIPSNPSGLARDTLHPKTQLGRKSSPKVTSNLLPQTEKSSKVLPFIPIFLMALLAMSHFWYSLTGQDTQFFIHLRMGISVFSTMIAVYLSSRYSSLFVFEDIGSGRDPEMEEYLGISSWIKYLQLGRVIVFGLLICTLVFFPLSQLWRNANLVFLPKNMIEALIVEQLIVVVMFFYQRFLERPDNNSPLGRVPGQNSRQLNPTAMEFAL